MPTIKPTPLAQAIKSACNPHYPPMRPAEPPKPAKADDAKPPRRKGLLATLRALLAFVGIKP